MASTDFFIDIGDEVISFAHEQGHTKARKGTINWRDLKSASGAAKFTTTSKTTSLKVLKIEKESRTILDYLTLSVSNHKGDRKCDYEKEDNQKCNVTASKYDVSFEENWLLNAEDIPVECKLAINPSLKNTATADVKLVSTLACSKETRSTKTSKNHHQKMNKPSLNQSPEDREHLKKIPLSPKFCIRLSSASKKRQKISCKARPIQHQAITLPKRTECEIEIIEHKEEEKGTFKVDYYLSINYEVA